MKLIRRFLILLSLLLPLQAAYAQYNPALQSPQAFLGFDLEERLADWGDITRYVDYLAAASDRVSVERFGYTFERRRFLQVCITSPANQQRLEEIRQEHLKVTDVAVSGTLDLDRMPLVVVPAQNPDGMSRFATWVNGNASAHHFIDTQSREYREVSPTGLLVVPVAGQPLDGPALHEVISALAAECAVDVTALPGGRRKTLDSYVKDRSTVRQPWTVIITDTGASSQQGSLWHLLDEHYAMNHSLVDLGTFAGRNFDIGRYDVLVFSGNVALDKVDAAAWSSRRKWLPAARFSGAPLVAGSP